MKNPAVRPLGARAHLGHSRGPSRSRRSKDRQRLAPARRTPRVLLSCACAAFMASGAAHAQTSVPLLEPKPVFTPGMYETESRNSAFQDQPVKSRTCIASADYDAFRDDDGAVSAGAALPEGLPPERHQNAQERLCV